MAYKNKLTVTVCFTSKYTFYNDETDSKNKKLVV